MNGEQVVFESVANDAQVPARTVREYFLLLEDTLITLLDDLLLDDTEDTEDLLLDATPPVANTLLIFLARIGFTALQTANLPAMV